VQKIPSAKYLLFILTFISLDLLPININSYANTIDKSATNNSAFSVLNDGLYKQDSNDVLIVKQQINIGDTESLIAAKIRLLKINTGISTEYDITKDDPFEYIQDTYITLHDCKKEKDAVLNPLHMALISIKNDDDMIFNGWIFTNNPSVSLPNINKTLLYLIECQ
jgi:hypothetical protein